MKNDHPPHRLKRLYGGSQSLSHQAAEAVYRHGLEHRPDGVVSYSRVYDGPLSILESLARQLSKSSLPLATLERPSNGHCEVRLAVLGRQLVAMLKAPWTDVQERYAHYKVMPQFKLLMRLRRFLPLDTFGRQGRMPKEDAERMVDAINRVANTVRKRLRSTAMKRAIDNFSRGARDNYKSLLNGVEWLAERTSKVVSLRIDLHWEDKPPEHPLPYSKDDLGVLGQFMPARETFQALLKVKFGNRLLASAWCLEHGMTTRFHVHYWILLTPNGHTDAEALVDELGEQWKELGGKGRGFYNCHMRKRAHRYAAIGEVDLYEPDVRQGVQALGTYFTAAGLFLKLDVEQRFRTFGMSGFPRKPKPKRGPKARVDVATLRFRLYEARDRYAKWV